MAQKLSNKSLASYSLLAFALSFVGLPLYIYLPNFYANNFGLDLKTIALILLFTRFIDAIQDPIFGILSDKFSHLKRKIITFTTPFLGISFFFLFSPQTINHLGLWLTIFLILTYSFFSLIYINYQSYAVSFSKDYNTKTRIIAFREIGFILGIIFAASTPAFLSNLLGEVVAFKIIGAFYFLLITAFALVFYYFAPKILNQKSDLKKTNFSATFKNIFSDNSLKNFFLIFLFNAISAAIPASLILFFIEDVLKLKSFSGLFLLLYFFGLLIGNLLWSKISQKFNNKTKTWLLAMFVASFSFIWCYFLGENDLIFYALICFISGIGFGADFCLGYSILTDLIQEKKLENNESTIFGITNFIIKISLTFSSAILIYFIGYFADNAPEFKVEFISFSYSILPIIFRILAMILLYFYFIKKPNNPKTYA